MTHEEQAFRRILKQLKTEDDIFWLKNWYYAASAYKELADPIAEAESKDGIYLCRREAFVSSFDRTINFGYTVCKWDGTFREIPLHPGSSETFKFKNWREIYHSHSEKKVKPVEMIDIALKQIGVIKEFDS